MTSQGDTPPRVGLLHAGDLDDPRTWSGIPYRLAAALREVGVALTPIDVRPPAPGLALNVLTALRAARQPRRLLQDPLAALRRSRWEARATPLMGRLFGMSAGRRLAKTELDAIVQVQAEFEIRATVPLATYEDLTVELALRHGYVEFAGLSSTGRRRRIDVQRRAYERATACCTTTHWARASIIEDYGIPPERVHVVGIGAAPPPSRLGEARDWTHPRFLFVGQDWERKNGEAVLRSFRRLRQTVAGAELHLVGGHPVVHDQGVVGHGPLRLDRPGERARLWDLFATATCLVMPSRVEPSAIVYLEAAGCGVPSIGTAVGGSAELIGDGGIVVDPHDDEQLFDAMSRVCDPATAARLGDLARRRALRYAWPTVAARILTALGLPGFDEPALPAPSVLGAS